MTILWIFTGCYTFKSTSIDPNIDTFSVSNFDIATADAKPGLGQTISEAIKDRINRDTRLTNKNNGDVAFSGEVTEYSIKPISPQAGETTSRNRLTISVKVKFEDHLNPKKGWEQTFSHYADYDSNTNFSSVEDQLVQTIVSQLTDEIFRKAFENW